MRPVLVAVFATVLLGAACSVAYVLPQADRREGAAKPALVGEIERVDLPLIVIGAEESSSESQVTLSRDTKIFTTYGGYVAPDELHEGQAVRVWFERPGMPAPGERAIAVVLMIESLVPERP